jgi:Holliday junction DNA helicase RuvB
MDAHNIISDINGIKINSLDKLIGQKQVRRTLEMNIDAYFKARSKFSSKDIKFGPVMLAGPSGTGKTMVAYITHCQLGNDCFLETNGGAINKTGELYSVLLNADNNTTILIDEAQAMNSKTQQVLLTAISENKIYLPVPTKQNCTVELANFVLIFATTDEYKLLPALRNRMRIYCHFELYSVDELVEIITQKLNALKWRYDSTCDLKMIAQRSKNIPRVALNYLQTCWNVALTNDHEAITVNDVIGAFQLLQIDELGLNKKDRCYLAILNDFGSSTLNVLSSKMAESSYTLQEVIEPYLLRVGFIIKDKNSARKITQKGIEHMTKIQKG